MSCLAALLLLVGCAGSVPAAVPASQAPEGEPPGTAPVAPACGGAPLRVHFYDVAQGLSALVALPDGRRILVDAGESASRGGCGEPCRVAATHLQAQLVHDLAGQPITLLWSTHQHSDHIGGVPGLVGAGIRIALYADNGTDLTKAMVRRAREAIEGAGGAIVVVDPEHSASPVDASSSVTIRPVVPGAWPHCCERHPNDCSIGLRIDYCDSSVLFTGDAERALEGAIDPGAVSLLQVAHHGAETSSMVAFLTKVAPRYAVISSGRADEGLNRGYHHPRASAVLALSQVLGGTTTATINAYASGAWTAVPTPESLWLTARDGDVVLVTTGDGRFTRELPGPAN